jgi:hypothetical protein
MKDVPENLERVVDRMLAYKPKKKKKKPKRRERQKDLDRSH